MQSALNANFRLRRDSSAGDKCADSVAARYREEEVRGMFGVVVDANARARLPRHMA